jgi:queuosine precursor transporter
MSLAQVINSSKYYHLLTLIFTVFLLISNLAAIKLISIGDYFQIDAGTLFFPMLYVLNDILTEIYGFSASKRTIWIGFIFNILFSSLMYFIVLMPSSPHWQEKEAFDTIFTLSSRIVFASVSSYFVGELINSAIIARAKILLKGKFFAMRALFSTFVASTIESSMFCYIAFYGRIPNHELIKMIIMLAAIKVIYEIILMPLTLFLVSYLKKVESIDIYEQPKLL